MLPLFPSNTRDIIEQIIDMDGRQVTFQVFTYSGCQDCNLDPISGNSTDSYCPTCSGEYWIGTVSGWDVTAHVTWGKSEEKSWETGGMLDNGDCTVKFMHTPEAEEIVHAAKYVIVDDRTMVAIPGGIILRGVPEVNRIIVKLREKER